MALSWEKVELKDIVRDPVEVQREWLEWLEKRRVAEISTQAERHKILVGWSNPTGLIQYA